MSRILAMLLALLLLLAPAMAAAEPDNPAAGEWYSGLNGVPLTLSLNPDGGYALALPAVFGEPTTGTWALKDGFVRLSDGSVLNLVNESLLVWTENGLFFFREPTAAYTPADLMLDATLEDYAGYWACAWIDLGDAVVSADAVDETTDLYIENATVALGGPRFGDIFWTFDFADGVLSADVNGQPTALALQLDCFLRLTLSETTLYLQPVVMEEVEDE